MKDTKEKFGEGDKVQYYILYSVYLSVVWG